VILRRVLPIAVIAVIAGGVAVALGVTPIDRPTFIDRLEYPLDYGNSVRLHAARNHLDAALVAAVIYEESRFRKDATSKAGAKGLMQLQPVTAQTIAEKTGGTSIDPDDLYDPDLNIRYGTWYLRRLLDKYGNERVALAAYNAGETTVDRWIRRHQGIDYADVRGYVDAVEDSKAKYRRAYGSELPSD
jgi:soluble lytic murein transglycosylase